LAPDGIIREVVPLAGHEAILGHDLLRPDTGNREARLALETQRLALWPVRFICARAVTASSGVSRCF
jgi:hypothetical protein